MNYENLYKTLTETKKNIWENVPSFSFSAYRGVPVILVKALNNRCAGAQQTH